jgi:hypothetical protein
MTQYTLSIIKLTEAIRERINEPKLNDLLASNERAWLQLCSCLDALEDSDLAISAYLAGRPTGSPGAKYLAVYGVLQALFVQQDAAINLCESLGIQETINNHPTLRQIREIRNDSIGHPTKRDRKKGQIASYNFISRPTLDSEGFDLLSDDGDQFTSRRVVIRQLVEDQRNCICGILKSAIACLKARNEATPR